MAESTRWTHLPLAGGWYAQHPDLIDDWVILLELKQKKEDEDRRRQEAEMNRLKAKKR